MKKCGICYLVSLYVFLASFLIISQVPGGDDFDGLIVIFGFASVVIGVLAIINVFADSRKMNRLPHMQLQLNHMMLLMKMATIPFYIFNFIFWVIIFMTSLVIPGGILFSPIVLLGVFIAYSVLAATSAYSICNLYYIYKNGVMPKGKCVLHGILQILFVIDIFDTIYLYYKANTFHKEHREMFVEQNNSQYNRQFYTQNGPMNGYQYQNPNQYGNQYGYQYGNPNRYQNGPVNGYQNPNMNQYGYQNGPVSGYQNSNMNQYGNQYGNQNGYQYGNQYGNQSQNIYQNNSQNDDSNSNGMNQ